MRYSKGFLFLLALPIGLTLAIIWLLYSDTQKDQSSMPLGEKYFHQAHIELKASGGDDEAANKYYKKSCDEGYQPGCYSLGRGKLAVGKYLEGTQILKGFCNDESVLGCEDLAHLAKLRSDDDEAVRLLNFACKRGSSNKTEKFRAESSCYKLAKIKEEAGLLEDATKYFKLACMARALRGCDELLEVVLQEGSLAEVESKSKLACGEKKYFSCVILALIEVKRGDLDRAKQFTQQACDNDELVGCSIGRHVDYLKRSYPRKLKEQQIQCNDENLQGCHWLGMIEEKFGKIAEARRYYEMGCNAEDDWACQALAAIEQKQGNLEQAKIYYKLACDKENKKSCYQLAMVENELGNHSSAITILESLCSNWQAWTCHGLGKIELANENLANATRYFKLACDRGNYSGCSDYLAVLRKDKDITQLEEELSKSCQAEDPFFCVIYGLLAREQKKFETAIKAFDTARKSRYSVARSYFDSLRSELRWQNRFKEFYEKACKNGEPGWCTALGDTEDKLGHPELAREAYSRACSRGHQKGCEIISDDRKLP